MAFQFSRRGDSESQIAIVPESFSRETLSITVAILSFAVMDLRREWRYARKEVHRQAQATQWLLGTVEQMANSVNFKLVPFKFTDD